MFVSVVLPCKNEQEGLSICLEEISAAMRDGKISAEILVVDDHSTDETRRSAEEHGAIVIESDGAGYGSALRTGFKKASGDVIVIGDADGSYDFTQIPTLLSALKDSELVIGSRFVGAIEDGAMPHMHRYIGNPLLTAVLNLLFDLNVSDAHCGLRAVRKDALNKLSLKSEGMELASEMLAKASILGVSISEVPIRYRRRKGRSKLNAVTDGMRHIKLMISLYLDRKT
jgi:glycosyltransferase involved in cell wall biosynthesis